VKRLVWLDASVSDLEAIARYFSARDPDIALVQVGRIQDAARALLLRDTGRPDRMPGLREKSVRRTSYVIAYEVIEQGDDIEIRILRIVHSSRHWTKTDWPSD
jgi:plasmid stabilization system protein ParE